MVVEDSLNKVGNEDDVSLCHGKGGKETMGVGTGEMGRKRLHKWKKLPLKVEKFTHMK